MKRVIIFIYLILIIVLSSCSTKERVLQFNLKEGEVYSMIQQTSITMNNLIKSGFEAEYGYEVKKKINDTLYEIELHFKRIKLEMKTASENISMDSEKPTKDQDPIGALLVNLAGKSFSFKLNSLGEMYDITGLKEIYDDLYNNLQMDNRMLNQVTQTIDQFFSEKSFRGNLRMMTSMFGKQTISKGSTWQSRNVFDNVYSKTVMINNWSCDNIRKNRIYIQGQSEMMRMPDDERSSGLLEFIELSGDFNSEIILDSESCWPVRAVFNQELSGKVALGEPHEDEHGHKHNVPFVINASIQTIISSR